MDLRFLSLFVSFKDRSTAMDVISLLNTSGLLEEVEKNFITSYSLLFSKLDGVPTRDLLIQQFPGYGFDVVQEIQDSVLMDNVQLFLTDKKNKDLSTTLMSLVGEVRVNGVSDDVKDKLLGVIEESSLNKEENSPNIINTIKDKYEEEKAVGGILTGVEEVDNNILGLSQGTITTVMGYTGSYKTLYAVNIAHAAMVQGKNVCYVSLEVPKEHLVYDLLSKHSNNAKFKKKIAHFDIKKHKLKEEDKNYLFDVVLEDFKELPGKIILRDESDIQSYTKLGFSQLFRKANEELIDSTGRGVELLIIDHAQLLKFNESGFSLKDPYQIVNYYVSFFRQQTLNFLNTKRQIATVILSQASREGYKNAAKHQGKYDMTALAEANELDRASQNVIALYTDESLKNSKQAKIQILKARDGSTMAEPEIIFADPEYYTIGNTNIVNPIDIETFDTEDLFDVKSFNTGISEVNLND